MNIICLLFVSMLVLISGFRYRNVIKAPTRLQMAALTGKKGQMPSVPSSSSSSTVKTGYVPDGLTPEQYQAILNAESAKKEESKKRHYIGKEVESLTEWMENNEKKGLRGLDLNRKGHRMVKAKYDGWYTKNSPV